MATEIKKGNQYDADHEAVGKVKFKALYAPSGTMYN